MAGLKRKEAPTSTPSGDSIRKKPKKGALPAKKSERAGRWQEAETDSDPLVESDTTERSGDDDGVSWPSDEDQTPIGLPLKSQKPHNEEVDETSDVQVPLGKVPIAGKDGNNGRLI